MAKRKKKLPRIKAIEDDDDRPKPRQKQNKKKKQTNFATDLVDTSQNMAKRLRYDANQAQKTKGIGKKGKPFKGKVPKGKTFGKPQAGKQGKKRNK